MDAVSHDRGLDLVAAHCASLDPDSVSARDRLDVALGPNLARMLVFALCGAGDRERSRQSLGTRPVFAA
jgi:hypothetical protein